MRYIEKHTTMTYADFSRLALLLEFRNIAVRQVRETSSDKGIVFPSYTHFIYTNRSE